MLVFEERGNQSARKKPLGAEQKTNKLNPPMMPDFTQLTTRTNCGHLLAVVLLYLDTHHIPYALGCRAYLWLWQEEGAFYVCEHAPSSSFCPLLSTIYLYGGCLSSRGHGGLMAGL